MTADMARKPGATQPEDDLITSAPVLEVLRIVCFTANRSDWCSSCLPADTSAKLLNPPQNYFWKAFIFSLYEIITHKNKICNIILTMNKNEEKSRRR
jgi:hypothetical protein